MTIGDTTMKIYKWVPGECLNTWLSCSVIDIDILEPNLRPSNSLPTVVRLGLPAYFPEDGRLAKSRDF